MRKISRKSRYKRKKKKITRRNNWQKKFALAKQVDSNNIRSRSLENNINAAKREITYKLNFLIQEDFQQYMKVHGHETMILFDLGSMIQEHLTSKSNSLLLN